MPTNMISYTLNCAKTNKFVIKFYIKLYKTLMNIGSNVENLQDTCPKALDE